MQYDAPTDVSDDHPKHLILLAPLDVELPSGFPFKKVTGTDRERFLAAIQSDEPIVLPMSADHLSIIRQIAPLLDLEVKQLQHTVGDYSPYWNMQAKPFPLLTVREIMETRGPTNPGTPPKLTKDDVAGYNQLLDTLDKGGATDDDRE